MTPLLTGVFASQISGHLTPAFSPTGSYDAITSYTVGAGGISSVTFSGIPSGYKHLQIRSSIVMYGTWYQLNFNADTSSSYRTHELRGDGSNAASYDLGAYDTNGIWIGISQGSSAPNAVVTDILDYNSTTKNKTVRSLAGSDINTTDSMVQLLSGGYFKNDAITSITLTPDNPSNTFLQHTKISLYGVKG